MIEAAVIITAMIVFLMVSTQVLYQARMDARLKHIDELVKRGVDINTLMEKDEINDSTK